MKLNKKKKGFTLIELMAVIAIIAILAAVLVPTVSGYITRAKKTAVITQARSVVNAVSVYNQSAAAGNQISDTSTKKMSELVSLIDLLDGEDTTKLGGTTVYKIIKLINEDPEAANNITVDTNGVLNGYKNLNITTGETKTQ